MSAQGYRGGDLHGARDEDGKAVLVRCPMRDGLVLLVGPEG